MKKHHKKEYRFAIGPRLILEFLRNKKEFIYVQNSGDSGFD